MGAYTDAFQQSSDMSGSDDAPPGSQDAAIIPTSSSSASPSTQPAVAAATSAAVPDTSCEMRYVVPRATVTLAPCGHSRFCTSCVDTLSAVGSCPICRAPTHIVFALVYLA